jgi:hypothetical protein
MVQFEIHACHCLAACAGIEKAERNVLPTLNNLLENREMALEDGRFLTSPARFDSLLKVCRSIHSQYLLYQLTANSFHF